MLSFFTIEIIDLTREFTLPEICASLEMRIICKIVSRRHSFSMPPKSRGWRWGIEMSGKYVDCREVITSHCRQHLNAGGKLPTLIFFTCNFPTVSESFFYAVMIFEKHILGKKFPKT